MATMQLSKSLTFIFTRMYKNMVRSLSSVGILYGNRPFDAQIGPVYRSGPNRLIFSSLKALEDIYSHPHITKGPSYRHSRWMDPPNIFDEPNRLEHRRKRKVIGQAVSDRLLRAFQPTLSAQVDVLLRQLLKTSRRGETINMTPLTKRLAVDTVGHLAFGYALNTQTNEENRFIPKAMGKAMYMSNLYYTWPALGIILPVLRWLAKKKMFVFHRAVQNMIEQRMAQPQDARPDFYSVASGELEPRELWNEALFFIVAGGTTVSTSISATLFHLCNYPDAYARLATEIRSTFSSGSEIQSGPKLAGCKYLRAVIEESLRLTPPSLSPLWRVPEPTYTEPFIVDGHVIPPGTEVGIHLYSFLHDPTHFPEPFSFRPERWLAPEDEGAAAGSEANEARAKMRRAQVSFGAGERSCAGKSMAFMEATTSIARILWYFDFELAPGEAGTRGAGQEGNGDPWAAPNQMLLYDIITADHDGPELLFKPREQFCRELDEMGEQESLRSSM
ncbi:hypothetical protein HIM_07504 [Hirsutella minnesotensis 3608]|uniref:Cytochrome P450 monooxygenase n=1 Tax=Hirsutella minnesotensis 3608 TaxID=1043627 RepID=A0A0F7ZN47_9HYPO|nr:hypothetical protein HIM_07504 [Hirsutella minnesotensis 3608]